MIWTSFLGIHSFHRNGSAEIRAETTMSSGRGSYMANENRDALTSSTRTYAKSRGYIQTLELSISLQPNHRRKAFRGRERPPCPEARRADLRHPGRKEESCPRLLLRSPVCISMTLAYLSFRRKRLSSLFFRDSARVLRAGVTGAHSRPGRPP
jgi:hypothetical protein